jgi:signal peptidase
MINSWKAASQGAALKTKKKIPISKILYWVLLVVIITIAVIPTISSLDIPLPFRLYSVQTGSMNPTIKIGDLIFVKEVNSYKQGDIITFVSGTGNSKTTITHRIEKKNEDNTFTTKGDANTVTDVDTVREENILGKYFFRIPLLGYPINLVRTPLGFLILIVIPSVIIGYEEIKKIKNEIVSKRNKIKDT